MVFHPAATSPSPIKVKATNSRNSNRKYQRANNNHFHHLILNPRAFAHEAAPTTTAPVSKPTINASTTRFVIMV
jgi:hypothetical protein